MNGGARVTGDGGGEPERTTTLRSPLRAPALPGPAPSLRSDVANVLALQRTAGNAAVADGWADGPGRRRVSHYEAGEHAQVGGDDKVMVNGVLISRGQPHHDGRLSARPRTCTRPTRRCCAARCGDHAPLKLQ